MNYLATSLVGEYPEVLTLSPIGCHSPSPRRKAVSDMDEYIKREDVLDVVLFALVGTGHQSQAIYAIRDIPATDVVPKSEVDKVRLLAYESGKREVAREILNALHREIIEARNSNFKAIRERETKHNVNRFEDTFCYYCDGKIHALDGIFYFVDEFLKKYEEGQK